MSNFQKFPFVEVNCDSHVSIGWQQITARLSQSINLISKKKKIIVIEFYQGVLSEEVTERLIKGIPHDYLIQAEEIYKSQNEIREMVYPDVTDDRLFGYLTRLNIDDYFDKSKLTEHQKKISGYEGTILIIGIGAALIAGEYDLLVYADMARWEIQLRMREHRVGSIGLDNKSIDDWMLLYKQGYFVDWRVCDRLKKKLMKKWDFLLDTNNISQIKLIEGSAILEGLRQTINRPFSVVPFFDPGPWGGQWMKNICNLNQSIDNFAWCFNCVPEENSLMLKFGDTLIEIPSIDLVFYAPQKLLGDSVHARFGDEFPIRFDFLDTMGGGNLSMQVHPQTEYIQEKFGIHYTQDESYYIMDTKEGSKVYLGLRENINPKEMIHDLIVAQETGEAFNTMKYVQSWQVKKHDHYLIPAGTIHCSGKDSMVLEISATPYIFTFKLWDWGRLGLDGKPRPINIEHGKNVIQWNRNTSWIKNNLVNQFVKIDEGPGWYEEKTGLHEREFIETRRHWFTTKVLHKTTGSVEVINVVEGDQVIVESPTYAFEPFVANYAETFIIPACISEYTICPYGESEGKKCATIKAFVRTGV
jgi:mannose-6-phosphate isomerase class I